MYFSYNHKEATNAIAVNPKYDVDQITFCGFHYTVGNVLTERYAFDFNIKKLCIEVGISNICEEVNDSRCSWLGFWTSNRISQI